ncbi:MAG: phosphatidate cytidylyltransferase, partial [Pseudomonadota bacterium]
MTGASEYGVLRSRIITALTLAPLVIAAVFLSPAPVFALLFCLIICLGMYEWAGLAGYSRPVARIFYCVVFAALCAILYMLPTLQDELLGVGAIFWISAMLGVVVYPRGGRIYRQRALVAAVGWLVGVCAWVALLKVRGAEQGSIWLLWVLVLVWAADIGAYFAGKTFGRHALAPNVSPGKTWEGAAGGTALAALVCSVALLLWQGFTWQWLLVICVLVAISIFGDLFESVLKRSSDTKDSGNLLPGHGGMLDRIDS